jgi:hypothetical protein
MGQMGKLRVVLVNKKIIRRENRDDNDDNRFHRPGRIDRSIENGKEYRSLSYDDARPIDDLLPDEARKQETSVLTTKLDYVLMLNFDAPIPKTL